MTTGPILTPDDFQRVRQLVYRKTGMSFDDSKQAYVVKRVQQRIAASGAANFQTWFTRLCWTDSGAELQELVNLLTVNETYFFRETYQFDAIVRTLLDEVAAHHPHERRLRLWSLPCATGEEPYSLAIYLLEHWSRVDEFEIEIVGSDIDTEVVAQAREGLYSARSVQNLSPELMRKYFRPAGTGRFQICDSLRESIMFTQTNLNDPAIVAGSGRFDIILCRNLLIYFDEPARRRAASTLYDALRPGGVLCLGHSESMSRISNLFEVKRLAEAIVYQRPLRGSP